MSQCSVCEHPQRGKIDGRLAVNDSIPRLAQFYDLDTRLLHVHKREHVTQLAPALLSRPHATLADLEWIEDECRAAVILLKGEPRMNYQSLALMLSEMRRCKETAVKLAKELHLMMGGGMPAEWEELREKILKALEPFPAAMEAVLTAIDN